MLLAHDIDGAGDSVALLHSSVGDRRMFAAQWEPLLAAGYRVLRVDFRGAGETPAPTGPHNHADDLRDVLDEYEISRVALVGSSFGGRVAQEFAARWPDRVSRLVLLCAARAGHPETPDISAFAEQESELIDAGDLAAAVALNVTTFLGPEADDATRDLVARMQLHNFEVQLAGPEVDSTEVDYDVAAITAPTLVVSGGHDLAYFNQIAEYLGQQIAAARVVRLDWAGHLPSLEDPARLNPVLLDFLGS
jgi:3-oxoadipate enol-lactonase